MYRDEDFTFHSVFLEYVVDHGFCFFRTVSVLRALVVEALQIDLKCLLHARV